MASATFHNPAYELEYTRLVVELVEHIKRGNVIFGVDTAHVMAAWKARDESEHLTKKIEEMA